MISKSNNDTRVIQGRFSWVSNDQQDSLDFTNPIGITLAKIRIHNGIVELKQLGGLSLQFSNFCDLTEYIFDQRIPMDDMKNWLSGIVNSNNQIANIKRDFFGNPTSFSLNDWQVILSLYDVSGPQFISMEYFKNTNDHIFLKIIMDRTK